ncbi:hypothetical protein HK100_005821 [Physocladia obscura]|uniref:B30.2/SPRY domain-containing protein n=1 Tax=Physocladia obscura TaxID=109957 RepID=A0AAD5T6C3_9FUNG|nr:hypothetical protein HK100_005821 [Physocladia obscura]
MSSIIPASSTGSRRRASVLVTLQQQIEEATRAMQKPVPQNQLQPAQTTQPINQNSRSVSTNSLFALSKDPAAANLQAAKDLAAVREACHSLHTLSQALWADVHLRAAKDLKDLDAIKDKILMEDEFKTLEMDTIVSIVSVSHRKDIIRANFMAHMNDEKEMSNTLQQHKDEFSLFIWKRRVQAKKELRSLFSNGSGMMCRLGDLVSGNTMEAIQLFEQSNNVRLTRDVVRWSLCEAEDIPIYLGKKMALVNPKTNSSTVILRPNRLEFHISEIATQSTWGCVYANLGPCSSNLTNQKIASEITSQSLDQVLNVVKKDANGLTSSSLSFLCILARTIDAIHPTHQLQGSVLAFPLYAGTIIKKRLVALGYNIAPFTEDTGVIDGAFAANILKQIYNGLVRQQRFFFEVSFQDFTVFVVGLISAAHMHENDHTLYAGIDDYSFGFSSTGEILCGGTARPYITFSPPNSLFETVRTMGVLVDLYNGSICLVFENTIHRAAFGAAQAKSEYSSNPEMQINFGRTTFLNAVDAKSFDSVLKYASTDQRRDGFDQSFIIGSIDGKDGGIQEDEERLQLQLQAADKSNFRATVFMEAPKSFSQFPPSIYRRSLACTKIQRVWRRFRGRRDRKKLRELQYEAATIIQRVARRKLRHLHAKKHESARPIFELHQAAKIIQRKWRNWFMFRNSPIAAKYNARIEQLESAVNKIITWWRPLHKKISDRRRMKSVSFIHYSATTIQRVWRGYILRKMVRDELRVKLVNIGRQITQHRCKKMKEPKKN